jgi:16S rRNA (guanine1207-N2)-methyltransferase
MIETASYYRYRPLSAEIRGRPVPYVHRSALGDPAVRLPAARLLAEWAMIDPQHEVLLMHCGNGLVGAALAAQSEPGAVVMLDSHVAAVETSRQTLQANDVFNAQVMLSDCAQAVEGRPFDRIVALLPKGRAVWERTVLDAAAHLRTDGHFYLSGANRSGIKSAGKFIRRAFGNVTVLGYRRGCQVLRAVKKPGLVIPPSDYDVWRTASDRVGNSPLEYVTKPGLFSWKRLDAGTRLMVECLAEHPILSTDRVLDIGCGSGVLSLVAARQAQDGHVTAVDADCRAVEATRRTLIHNHIGNAEVILSDCGWAVRDRSFTVVVTNPPFHQDKSTTYVIAEQIIRDAAHLLQRDGRLYLVANSFLKYRPIIQDAFGNVSRLCHTNHFTVWHAVKRR